MIQALDLEIAEKIEECLVYWQLPSYFLIEFTLPMNTRHLSHPSTRCNFLRKSSWLLGAAVAAPSSLPKKVWGANSRLRIAWIGLGSQGRRDLRRVANGNELVAICDCDLRVLNAPKMLEAYPQAKRFQDFRIILAEMGDSPNRTVLDNPSANGMIKIEVRPGWDLRDLV